MRSIVILLVMNLFVFNQNIFAVQNTQDCANRQIEDFKRTSNLKDSSQRRNAVLGYIKRNCNVDKEKASKLLEVYTSKKPAVTASNAAVQADKNRKVIARPAKATGSQTAPSANGGTTDGLPATSLPSTNGTSSNSPSKTSPPAAQAESSSGGGQSRGLSISGATDVEAKAAIMKCKSETNSIQSNNGTTTSRLSISDIYNCACLGANFEQTQTCKNLKKDAGIGKDDDDDDENSCSGLLKAYNKSLEDKDEACGKGPNAGSCIQDYMDCTSGVLKNKDVYENVNDKLTDAMKLQALFKSAGTQAGIPGKTLDKCNMLSGRDFFAKKDKLEEKKKDLERDLQEAKNKILENQKNNAIEAQELKDQIANLKTEFEDKKKSMSEEMRNMTKSMIERSKDLESKKKETALAIQKKNIEIMNMLNGYNKQLAMVTMNGSSAANCKMEMMKQKKILDEQKLGGNVGNSIQKKNLLTTSFKTCMENLRKDLKLMQETFQKQKEIADTELINLNSTMSSYSEEIESSKRELEQFKIDHANELTTAEKSMMEKLMALAQRQQEQMQRTTQQNINDQELIKNYEAELRATTLEIMAMGNEEPSNREGDKNWAAVEDKIASARNKANDYYKACCREDGEHKSERSCKRLEDGDGSYRAIEKKGVKTVVPTNSTRTGKDTAH